MAKQPSMSSGDELPEGVDSPVRRMQRAMAEMSSRPGTRSPRWWFQVVGSVLLPFGVLLILLGWYGAAHTSLVHKQIPYAISGAALGLGLTIVGGFTFFGHLLLEINSSFQAEARERRSDTREIVAALDRLGVAMGLEAGGNAELVGVVMTPTGTLAHRPDCPVVAGRSDTMRVPGDRPGLSPCLICQPELNDEASAGAPPAGSNSETRPTGPPSRLQGSGRPPGATRHTPTRPVPRRRLRA